MAFLLPTSPWRGVGSTFSGSTFRHINPARVGIWKDIKYILGTTSSAIHGSKFRDVKWAGRAPPVNGPCWVEDPLSVGPFGLASQARQNSGLHPVARQPAQQSAR